MIHPRTQVGDRQNPGCDNEGILVEALYLQIYSNCNPCCYCNLNDNSTG